MKYGEKAMGERRVYMRDHFWIEINNRLNREEHTGWKSMELTAYISLLSLWHLNVKFLDCWASSICWTATLPSIEPTCNIYIDIVTNKYTGIFRNVTSFRRKPETKCFYVSIRMSWLTRKPSLPGKVATHRVWYFNGDCIRLNSVCFNTNISCCYKSD
jgi:hypothetical protein